MTKSETITFADQEKLEEELAKTLDNTAEELLSSSLVNSSEQGAWERAKKIVAEFSPVPWFIWRLSNFTFGSSGRPNKLTEGLVFGLKKLVVAAAADKVIGGSTDVTTTRLGLKAIQGDALAAVAVMHSISRRLCSKPFDWAWRPLLEDALLRAHVGFFVGQMNLEFGPGRGMLAGYSGRIGLAIMVACGDRDEASSAMEKLASGKSLKEVGESVYGVDPLRVSALLLSACGCGSDSAFGTVGWGVVDERDAIFEGSPSQLQWLSAFTITEAIRTNRADSVPEKLWGILGFRTDDDKNELKELVKILIRQGHGWDWIVNP